MAQGPVLSVYKTGALTVVGFGGETILDQVDLSACRAEVLSLVAEHGCKTLAFDLTGVKLVPSGLLGLLASLRNQGIEVQIFNPSDDVREVLQITRLDQVIAVFDVEL